MARRCLVIGKVVGLSRMARVSSQVGGDYRREQQDDSAPTAGLNDAIGTSRRIGAVAPMSVVGDK